MSESFLSQNESILSKKIRKINNNNRSSLIAKLGKVCIICGESDTRIIHIDHKYGQGYLEKHYFDSKEKMHQYYIDNFKEESKHLQLLCFNCNTKKRIINEEKQGRASLEEYFKILFKPDLSTARKICQLIDDNPQFIPIHDRLYPIFTSLLKMETEIDELKRKKDKILQNFSSEFPSKIFTSIMNEQKQNTGNFIPPLHSSLLNDTISEIKWITENNPDVYIEESQIIHHFSQACVQKNDIEYLLNRLRKDDRIISNQRGIRIV